MTEKMMNDEREQLEQMAEALEQILEIMPEDDSRLQRLYETFVKLEQPEKAFEYLARLADFALQSMNKESIAFVLQQYEALENAGLDVEGRKAQLRALLAGGGSDSSEKVPAAAEEGASPVAQDLEAEMALAWDLFQDEQLTEEEYSNVLHDLTEMSSRNVGVPVTVLHVLHDRQFGRFERLMTHLCEKSEIPIISLSSYEENESLVEALPFAFVSRRGVLPFASVGDDLLVAVLNPFDKARILHAEKESGQRCHPYLVLPDEYDQRLAQIKKALAA